MTFYIVSSLSFADVSSLNRHFDWSSHIEVSSLKLFELLTCYVNKLVCWCVIAAWNRSTNYSNYRHKLRENRYHYKAAFFLTATNQVYRGIMRIKRPRVSITEVCMLCKLSLAFSRALSQQYAHKHNRKRPERSSLFWQEERDGEREGERERGIMVFVSCFVGGEIALNVTCHLAAQMEI